MYACIVWVVPCLANYLLIPFYSSTLFLLLGYHPVVSNWYPCIFRGTCILNVGVGQAQRSIGRSCSQMP